ncbi:MAG: hypothetical protein ABL862_09455 [Candidatus Nitrotoga sp.]
MKTRLVRRHIMWRPAMVAAAVVLAAFSPLTHAEEPLSDCSEKAIHATRLRLMDGNELRPIILSVDVLRMAMCEGIDGISGFNALKGKLKDYKKEDAALPIGMRLPDWAAGATEACPNAGERGKCVVEVYRLNGYQTPREITFGKSGGLPFAMFLGHTGDAGHFEITGRAAKDVGKRLNMTWSPLSLALLQDASRDADFYEWGNPAAHAQTPNDPETALVDESARSQASSAFIQWSTDFLRKAVNACKAGKPRDALYLTGYALHGIQDLVFHKGITNAEHSFRDNMENGHIDDSDNPAYEDNMSSATRASSDILFGMSQHLQTVAPSCWGAMTSWSDGSRISSDERANLICKTGRDFRISAYFKYQRLANKVRNAKTDNVPHDKLFIMPRWIKLSDYGTIHGYVSDILAAWRVETSQGSCK